MVKGYNVLENDSFHFPKLNSSAESPCSGFSRKSTMPGRIGIRYKEMSIAYRHNDIDPCYNVSRVNAVVTAGTPLVQSGYLPSSRGQDKAHEKNMAKKERVREEKRIQREQERVLRENKKLMEKGEKRTKREKQKEGNKRRRE